MELHLEFEPLPAIQRPLWFACQACEQPVYNEAEAFRLVGAVNVDALRRALDVLYVRHAALRSVVTSDAAGVPQVAIIRPGSFPLECLDLRDQRHDEARRRTEQAAACAARRMFDMHTGPLVRASLLRCGDEEWILVLVMHHLVSDDGGVRLLLDELSLLYQGKTPSTTPEQPIPAQRSLELPPDHSQREFDLMYWRRMAGISARLDIPTDHPILGQRTFAGRRQPLPMEPRWFQSVQAAAMQLCVSPFAFAITALSVVLARLAQTDNVVIGTTVDMRSEAEAEDVVGCFIKTVPLPLRVDQDETITELVRHTQKTVAEAIAHSSIEFDEMISAAGFFGSSRSSPFRVALELHYDAGELRLPGIAVSRLSVDPGTAKFDFTFHLYAAPDISSYLEYSTEQYEETTARSVAGSFVAILEQLCSGRDRLVADLTLENVTDGAALAQWESGPHLSETALSPLPVAVNKRAELHPDRSAVVFGSETLTFAQLVRHADLLGSALVHAGTSRGEAVGVAVRRSTTQIAAAFGAWSAGTACAALDPDLPEDRLRRMMRTAGIRFVVVDADTTTKPAFADVTRIPAHLANLTARELKGRPVLKISLDDIAYLIFTSGTSGDPKPVEVRHRSLAAFGQAMDLLIFRELPEQARVAVNAPFTFDASWQGIQLLGAGHTIYPVPDAARIDAESMVDFLRKQRIEVLDATPTHVASLVDAGLLKLAGKALGILVVGGEAVPVGLWQALGAAELRVINVYGPTEFTVNATACAIESSRPQPSIGRPLAGVRARVLDPRKRRVPVGFPGELHLSGPQLAVGYASQPERTAERFIKGEDGSRQYVTGDLVRWRSDGTLDFLGRRDGQVKVRGYRIELTEIARVLRSGPGVADAAVVVLNAGRPSAVLHAALVLSDQTTEPSAVRAFAATQLPAYMLPASFAVLLQMPRTIGGKLDLAAITEIASAAETVPSASLPSTPTRRRLAAIWARLLRRESIRETDDFFAIGGNSLTASRLVRQVETEFGVLLPLQSIFGASTLAAMADALDSRTIISTADRDSRELVVPLAANGATNGERPLVLLHPLGGTLFAYQPLLRLLPPEVPIWGVRSPAAAGATEEHMDVSSMIRTYAMQLSERLPGRSISLFGWSLGGLIALAVAAELEHRGFQIKFVEVWDVGSGTENPSDEQDLVRAALRAAYANGAQPQHSAVLDLLAAGGASGDGLLEAVLERTRLTGGASDVELFYRNLQVIRHQSVLFRNWQPIPIRADVHAVYAEPSLRDGSVVRTNWGCFTAGLFTETTVRADHYQMMREPAVAESARGLLARLQKPDTEMFRDVKET